MSCSISSNLLLNPISHRTSQPISPISSYKPQCSKPTPPSTQLNGQTRRQLLFLLTATTAVNSIQAPSMAADIGLFGLRKKLKNAEQEAEVIVKEGFEAAERGVEAAERGVEATEKGFEAAERGVEAVERGVEAEVSFGLGDGLAQAGVVVGAEAVGVLVATSIVNGILGPESS